MSLRSLLNVTVEVRAPGTVTKNAYGGWTDTSDRVEYPAAVQVDSSRESMEYERQTKKRTFNVYLQTSTPIATNARILVNTGQYTGVLIDVMAAKADHAGRNTYWMLRGVEVVPYAVT